MRYPTSIQHDRVDATRVADVDQRVALEEYQVSRLSGRYGGDGFREGERARDAAPANAPNWPSNWRSNTVGVGSTISSQCFRRAGQTAELPGSAASQ